MEVNGDFQGVEDGKLPAGKKSKIIKWQPSGNKCDDELHLYDSGDMYDCTFKVGCQEYKCHKLILSLASDVFKAMLLGHFKEATLGPDEPIELKNVSPNAFDKAMRFIYGEDKNFGKASLAIEVYRFAVEMQLKALMAAVVWHFENLEPIHVLASYEFFRNVKYDAHQIEKTRMLLSEETDDETLMSQDWESVSSVTMLEVVQLKWMVVSEFTLFKALENWGLSQVAAHGGNLSALLLPLLQHVRFRLMTVADFCLVSMRSNVLSIEQQLMIVRCLALNNPDFLPPEFDKTNMLREDDDYDYADDIPEAHSTQFQPYC